MDGCWLQFAAGPAKKSCREALARWCVADGVDFSCLFHNLLLPVTPCFEGDGVDFSCLLRNFPLLLK
jgi:hypothetical protein